ncbi:hypothetical protein AB0I54_00190 [Streptomyces sp. NPDC050625]|uniref:hypothetical protein n=1 Tax=Streptomyces sp. NPDC050625 TaxID=3154629 RepID=UPI0034449710
MSIPFPGGGMDEPRVPIPAQPAQPYLLMDAFGRTYVSSAPTPAVLPTQMPTGLVSSCGCSHAPATPPRRFATSPSALVIGILVGGVVLVALLLSVAVVAASVAVVALSITVCAVVLPSMTRDSARSRRGPHGV